MIELCKRLIRFLQVRNAIRHADRMQKLTGKRHYVIQVFKKIRVYDRLHINLLISRGVLHKRLKDNLELTKVCLYYTNPKKK
ncbi:MAG: hypothetical protein IKO62_04815 [Bacteroidales bacterium]|jgi:hypothetical protein|nr:hypothetical protein [Bacteroidales bacterium]